MTNAQKWVAVFLVLFIVLFGLSKISDKEKDFADEMGYSGDSAQSESVHPEDGLALIKRSGCIGCHGSELQGTGMAPALTSVKEYWDRDALINYLRNPSSYSGDDRFETYREKYKNVVMPSYSNIDVKVLGKMADYLLSK